MLHKAVDAEGRLSDARIRAVLADALADRRFDGARVLCVVPDATRSCPLPLLFRAIAETLGPRAKQLTFLTALGTHPVPPDPVLWQWFGLDPDTRRRRYGAIAIEPHRWEDPATFRHAGTFSAAQISAMTGGLFAMEVRVAINRLVFEHDVILIAGPVFPHEVVGFSGGHKYLFPGIGEQEFINFFHWLGAVITNPRINGTRDTPVRRLVEEAAALVSVPRRAICLVCKEKDVKAVICGEVAEAWRAAVDVSTRVHTLVLPRPYASVLACAPPMYDDIWVAGKCMYKLENIVADGGELIIYAPHVKEISYSHGAVLDEVGYHVRDYFLAQWDRFKRHPWGVLAHSTHVRGVGAYADGVETPRIQVTLATGIPEERCRRVALGWRDPASIDASCWCGEQAETQGRLHVPHAGETLHLLADPPAWARAGA